ncbi:HAUS augmin-like complex subunit 8 isoform X2 [Heterocephalus glaber]|uniref:HAUS augmin-like complex subunit 8 isoform X2 n=1 Tax=Heterocephalus glaber TaxID=10181 RepID=A0AAX6SFM0_HETGA|nr:HAUS augmin-like complex subunit 8 isoform X2 [Heterocephalus glaber]
MAAGGDIRVPALRPSLLSQVIPRLGAGGSQARALATHCRRPRRSLRIRRSGSRGPARKPPAAGPSTPSSCKARGKRPQGGRVVESRYLQYERRAAKKAPAADTVRAVGKVADGVRRASQLPKGADGSGMGKGDLQSTLLEGHGTAPPDLDLSAINDKSMVRKTPQLEKTMSSKARSTSFTAPQRKSPDLAEVMEMVASQTLLLTLLTVKMEDGLARLEEKAERSLLLVCQEQGRLQQEAHKRRRELLLRQRHRELAAVLHSQMEALRPFEAVAGHFRDQYRTLATALDTTRHELPLCAIHLEQDGRQLLDTLEAELTTTHHLLAELGIGAEEDGQVLALLAELRDSTMQKDHELRRSFEQVLELSAEASKEAALASQAAWEDAQGTEAARHCYFSPKGGASATFGGTQPPAPAPRGPWPTPPRRAVQ